MAYELRDSQFVDGTKQILTYPRVLKFFRRPILMSFGVSVAAHSYDTVQWRVARAREMVKLKFFTVFRFPFPLTVGTLWNKEHVLNSLFGFLYLREEG